MSWMDLIASLSKFKAREILIMQQRGYLETTLIMK